MTQQQLIQVKSYMTKKATASFDFMKKWNNDVPMPMRIMVGEVVKETRGMVYMKLHADILQEKTFVCMKCGRPLTNPVSQYFGVGPECGGHNYVNPFNSEEELHAAVAEYRKQLNDVTWEGWIIKSAIERKEVLGAEEAPQTEEAPQAEQLKKGHVRIEYSAPKKVSAEQCAFISFNYDAKLVNLMRAQNKRFWHAKSKQWEIPAKYVASLMDSLQDYDVEIVGEYKAPEQAPADVPAGFEFKTQPFAHQVEGFNFGLQHDRFLLGDEQGLGKTKQVIDIAVAKKLDRGYEHCLIVCGVNSLKWNWHSEVSTHSNEQAWILGQHKQGRHTVIGSNAQKLRDLQNINNLPYFIITNVESLRDAKICETIAQLCKHGQIGMVAIDEIHKCKNPASQQGKALLKVQPETRIAMTGTPLLNTPLDLYIVLKWLGYENHSFFAFKKHYCVMGGFGGYQVVGYRNLGELRESVEDVMIRRLKKDVLDLPEKMHSVEYIEMGKEQKSIYDQISQQIREDIDRIKVSPNPLAQLIRLRQATAHTAILSSSIQESAKLDRLEELVEELAENGQKCIIFSNWTDVTTLTYQRLKRFNPALITGEVVDRVAEQEKFMKDNSCKCIIGTLGALGTGLTLTAASTVIFLDSPWNRANKEQAEDRAHRIGTTSTVNIITLVCKDTIDERIEEIIAGKGAMADALIDGKVVGASKGQLVDFLLS